MRVAAGCAPPGTGADSFLVAVDGFMEGPLMASAAPEAKRAKRRQYYLAGRQPRAAGNAPIP
jgi:hypothetical protein